ncbi:MAG: LVIVD repeat-containing protein [Kofleriaceae bacterium]
MSDWCLLDGPPAPKLHEMSMSRFAAVVLLVTAGCGDSADSTPDSMMSGTDPPELVAECHELDRPAHGFGAPGDFGPVVEGSLADWDANGRWSVTGVQVSSISSIHFMVNGGDVIVDRDDRLTGTIDDNALFQRYAASDGEGGEIVFAQRVANLRSDGSLRFDRVVCDGMSCRLCTARLIRAAWNGTETESDGLTLVGELRDPSWDGGLTLNVRVVGTLAYVIRFDGLHIIETADPAHPVQVGHYQRNGDGYSNDLKIVQAGDKRYALIADYPVDVVDVTDPTKPMLAGNIAEEAHTLFTEERGGKVYAYFGNYDGTCPVFDVTDPAAPERLGRFDSGGELVHDLSIKDGVAYLNAWDAGFQVVDFTDPEHPALKGSWQSPTDTSHSNWTTTAGGRHIAVHGDEAYGAHLDVVDLDPESATFMQSIGSYKKRDWVSIHNIMAFGDRAYVAYYQDGVRVFDLSNPTQPTLLGYFNTWDPQGEAVSNRFFEGAVGIDVDFARKLIFVADAPRGLLILKDET